MQPQGAFAAKSAEVRRRFAAELLFERCYAYLKF